MPSAAVPVLATAKPLMATPSAVTLKAGKPEGVSTTASKFGSGVSERKRASLPAWGPLRLTDLLTVTASWYFEPLTGLAATCTASPLLTRLGVVEAKRWV